MSLLCMLMSVDISYSIAEFIVHMLQK